MELPTSQSLQEQTNNLPVEGLPSTGKSSIDSSVGFNLPSQDELDRTQKDNLTQFPSTLTTPIKREDYEPILKNIRPELGLDYLNQARALAQGNWSQLGNALIKSAEGVVVGETLQGIGALGELPEMLADVWNGTNNTDFNNFMMEWGDKVIDHSNKIAPIYRENPDKAMDFGDFAYWADNIPSVFSSISLMIPAIGFEKAGSAVLAKAFTAMNLADKVGDSTKYWSKLLTTAAFMRNGENVMEAHSVFQEAKKASLEKLDSSYDEVMTNEFMNSEEGKELRKQLTGDKEQDKEIISNYVASKASWLDYKMNSMNYAFDVMQLMPLFKGFPLKTRANSWLNVSDDVAKVVGKNFTKGEKIARGLYPVGVALGEQLTEGVEEAINGISQKEAEYQYGRELGEAQEVSAAKRFDEYLSSNEIYDQALWGFLGGVTFSGATRLVGKFAPSAQAKIDQSQIQLSEIGNRQGAIQEYYKQLQDLKGRVASKKITPEQAKAEFNTNKSLLAAHLGFDAAQAGNVDLLLNQVNNKEFRDGILKSYSAEDLKEIGVEDLDKSIQHMSDDIETTERLYKEAYNNLYTKDLSGTLKSKIARQSVLAGFVADRLRFENNELENEYTKVVASDDYFKNSREDMAENTIQLNSLEYVIDELEKQKVATQVLHGVGSPEQLLVEKKIAEYEKVRDKIASNIGTSKASLKGMNPKIQNLRNKMLWNEVIAKHQDEVSADLLSDKKINEIKKKTEEAKKKVEEQADKDFETKLTKEITDGKHTVATLTGLKDIEKSTRRKKFLEAKITEVDNKAKVSGAKLTKTVTAPKPTAKPETKVEKEIVITPSTETPEQKAAKVIEGFDPTTANLNYAKIAPKDMGFQGIIENSIANGIRNGSSTLDDLLIQLEDDENSEEIKKLIKYGIHKKLNPEVKKVSSNIEDKKADIERRRQEDKKFVGEYLLSHIAPEYIPLKALKGIKHPNQTIAGGWINKYYDAELAALDPNQTKIDEIDKQIDDELKNLNKKSGMVFSTIIPIPPADKIISISKIVGLLIKKGYYKFKQILSFLQSRYNGRFNEAIFNAVRTAYINEVKERKAKGEDTSKFDNIAEISNLQFEKKVEEDTSVGKGYSNLYLGTFDAPKKHYESLEDGYKANNFFVENAYNSVRDMKVGDKLVIVFDKNNPYAKNKTAMEDIPLKVMTTTGIQIGFLNDLTNLNDTIEYAKSLDQLEEIDVKAKWDRVYKGLIESGERPLTTKEKMLYYKVRDVNQQLYLWEKPFSTWVNETLVSNYNATKQLRELFATGKDSGKVLEVELGNKTGGEFAKIEWTTVGEVHGDDIEVFMVNPGFVNEDLIDASIVDVNQQSLVSNKDPNKEFTKVNKNLIYRNTDAQYTQGTIYMLLPTFMSDKNDYKTFTPSPVSIQSLEEDNLAYKNTSRIIRSIIKMQTEGTTFKNEDLTDLIKQLGYYVNVRNPDSKNKLGVSININTVEGKDISNVSFEFYHKNKRYKAIIYAKGTKLNDFGEFEGYINGQSMVVYEEILNPDGTSEYGKLSEDNEDFVGFTDTTEENKDDFREYFKKILLSLSRNVNWKLLKSNEGVEGYESYQKFLNATNAWKTDVGKVYGIKGDVIGYTTPFGNNKLVVSLNPSTAKSVAAKSNSQVTKEQVLDKIKECT